MKKQQLQLLAPEDTALMHARVRAGMSAAGMDSLLVSDNANIFYLTGRIFDGYIYFAPDGSVTYLVRRPSVLEGDGVAVIRKPEDIPAVLQRLGVAMPGNTVGLELDQASYSLVSRLQAAVQAPAIANADAVMREARAVKTPYEISLIADCGERHERVYRQIPRLYREGMTDIELQIEIERITRLEGGMGQMRVSGHDMEINMGSVLAGRNADTPSPYDFALGGAGASPALPVGADGTILRPGMAVMVDTNGDFNGYMTDMTRTFRIGDLPAEAYEAHSLSRAICRAVEAAARPGVECRDLYDMALKMVADAGMAHIFMGRTSQAGFIGHGVGITINELPVLSPRSKNVIQAGNVIAVEPKFVIKDVGAVGIENTYVVTDAGLRCLTNAPEEILSLGA